MKRAVVAFSGGQDSTTTLGHALALGYDCAAIGFNYGQRHAVELDQATLIAKALNVPFKVIDVRPFGAMVTSAMTGKGEVQIFGQPHARMKDVPSSFVPNRNALFLTIAHAYAQELDASSVWTGVCETDFSGYPDCRLEFIEALEVALNIGYKTSIAFVTPLMDIDKAATFAMAEKDGVLDLVINESHTCYEGDHTHKHAWGYGCGTCPSCLLRKNGWEQYQANRHPEAV